MKPGLHAENATSTARKVPCGASMGAFFARFHPSALARGPSAAPRSPCTDPNGPSTDQDSPCAAAVHPSTMTVDGCTSSVHGRTASTHGWVAGIHGWTRRTDGRSADVHGPATVDDGRTPAAHGPITTAHGRDSPCRPARLGLVLGATPRGFARVVLWTPEDTSGPKAADWRGPDQGRLMRPAELRSVSGGVRTNLAECRPLGERSVMDPRRPPIQ